MLTRFYCFVCIFWYFEYCISCNSRWNCCWLSRCFFDCCVFSNNRNSKEIIEHNKKKHNKIVTLAKSKQNSIETLMSHALIKLDISHEEFKTVVHEKEKYEQIKENTRNTKSRDELSENNRDIRENNENA